MYILAYDSILVWRRPCIFCSLLQYTFFPLFHCLTVIFIVYMFLLIFWIFWIFCRQLLQKSFLTSQCEDIIIWTCLNSPCPYKLQQRSRCDLWCDKEGAYNEMLGFWDHILVYSWQNVLKTWIKWAKVMLKKESKVCIVCEATGGDEDIYQCRLITRLKSWMWFHSYYWFNYFIVLRLVLVYLLVKLRLIF